MKSSFEELNHFITSITPVAAIAKTIIFIDNIDTAGKIAIHL